MDDYTLFRDGKYYNRYTVKEKLLRLFWDTVWFLFFQISPRWMLNTWRRWLLNLFGAKVLPGSMHPSVQVWAPWNLQIGLGCAISEKVNLYCVSPITIGRNVTISREAFICTASHDITSSNMELIHFPIVVEDYAWICSRAFIGPGVTIGKGAVVAACAVVTKDVAPWTVVGGNPARYIKDRVISEEE